MRAKGVADATLELSVAASRSRVAAGKVRGVGGKTVAKDLWAWDEGCEKERRSATGTGETRSSFNAASGRSHIRCNLFQ